MAPHRAQTAESRQIFDRALFMTEQARLHTYYTEAWKNGPHIDNIGSVSLLSHLR